MSGDMLYIITPQTYSDLSRDIALGTFEIVDAFQRLPIGTRGPPAPCVPGPDTSRSLSPGMRDPGCPPDVPAPGTPCNPQPPPLECEYGGDATRRCTTFAACARQPDGGYSFYVESPACPPNPAQCPATFSQVVALAGSTVEIQDAGSSGTNIACSYPEGVCACTGCGTGCQWACRARTDVTQRTGGSGAACPVTRPLAGEPCAHEGDECDYDSLCPPPLSLGPNMVCKHGNWVEGGEVASCPLENACVAPSQVTPDAG